MSLCICSPSTVAIAGAVGADPATAMVTGFRSAYGAGLVFVAVGIVAAVAFLRRPRKTSAVVTPHPAQRRDAA